MSESVISSTVPCIMAFLFCPPKHAGVLSPRPAVVEHADNGVGALPHVDSFIDQVIYLSGNRLAAHSKDGTLPGGEKVHGAGLEGVVWVQHLLCHVETVVGTDRPAVGGLF